MGDALLERAQRDAVIDESAVRLGLVVITAWRRSMATVTPPRRRMGQRVRLEDQRRLHRARLVELQLLMIVAQTAGAPCLRQAQTLVLALWTSSDASGVNAVEVLKGNRLGG
jgi:hypothetical protein